MLQLDVSFMPADFYRGEATTPDGQRHLIFATDEQLRLLKNARRWYIDATFKVVRDPFHQLMSIHAFVRNGDDVKQVPLVYVFMTRRKKIDYVKVLKVIQRKISAHTHCK